MTDQFFTDQSVVQRLHRGPLSAYVDGFAQALFERGYAAITAKQKLLLISTLSDWLQRRHLTVEDVSELKIERFILY